MQRRRPQMIQTFDLNNTVIMKKPHACGTNEWVVIRTGADIKIRCKNCGRIVMMDRADFMRLGKKVLEKQEPRN